MFEVGFPCFFFGTELGFECRNFVLVFITELSFELGNFCLEGVASFDDLAVGFFTKGFEVVA